MPSSSRRRQNLNRQLDYQSFEPRTMLASVAGTDGDDLITISVSGEVLDVDVNGASQSFEFDLDPQLNLDGLEGFDTVTLAATDGSSVEIVDGDLKVGQFSVVIANSETIDVADEGRILVRGGTSASDSVVFNYANGATSLLVNGAAIDLPTTETPLPLLFDASDGTDQLLINLSNAPSNTRVELGSITATDRIDFEWSGIENSEVAVVEGNDFFRLVSQDSDDVLYIDETSNTLVGETETLFTRSNLAFWHASGLANDAIVRGTSGDDTFEVNYRFGQSINFNESNLVYASTARISVAGGDGEDSIAFNLSESHSDDVAEAIIGPHSIDTVERPIVSWTDIENQSAGNMDEATLLDTAGDDDVFVEDDLITWSGEGFSWTLTDNDYVETTSSGGFDTVLMLSNPSGFSPSFYWEGLSSFESGQQRFLAKFFDDVTVRGTGEGARAFYNGTGGTDEYLLTDPDGSVQVELGDRVPVSFEGELDLAIRSWATATLDFVSARESTDIQLSRSSIELNGTSIELNGVSIDTATGNSSGDSLTLAGTSGDEELRTGMVLEETTRTTKLSGENYEISATGFENVVAELTEGENGILLWGIEDEAETVEIGNIDSYFFEAPNYNLEIVRGDFRTTETHLYGVWNYTDGDTLRYKGSVDEVERVRLSLNGSPESTTNVGITADTYTDSSWSPSKFYLETHGFSKFEFDLQGGVFDLAPELITEAFEIWNWNSELETTVTSNTVTHGEKTVTWNNIPKISVKGSGTGIVYDSAQDDVIEFGETEIIVTSQSNSQQNGDGVILRNSNDYFQFEFPDMTFISQNGGQDSANLSGDAESLQLGFKQSSGVYEGKRNLTVVGVDNVSANSVDENDFAQFNFEADIDIAEILVADLQSTFTSPNHNTTVSLHRFGKVDIAGVETDTLVVNSATSSDGTIEASTNEIFFNEVGVFGVNFPLLGVGQIELHAGTNVVPLSISGTDENDSLFVSEQELMLTSDSNSILARGYSELEVFGKMGFDTAFLQSAFDVNSTGTDHTLQNDNMFVQLYDFEHIDLGDSGPQTIQGTDGDDTFIVDYSGNSILVTQNGTATRSFSRDTDLQIDGKSGTDSISFIAPTEENVRLRFGIFATDRSSTEFQNVENLSFTGHDDGSTIDVEATDTWAHDISISESGVHWSSHHLSGFDDFNLTQTGASDRITLRDITSNGTVRWQSGRVSFNDDASFLLPSVGQVHLIGNDESDVYLFDSDQDDTLVLTDDQVEFSVGNQVVVASDFRSNTTTATEGNDRAFADTATNLSLHNNGVTFDQSTVINFDSLTIDEATPSLLLTGTETNDSYHVAQNEASSTLTINDLPTAIHFANTTSLTVDADLGDDEITVDSVANDSVTVSFDSIESSLADINWTNVESLIVQGNNDEGSIVMLDSPADDTLSFSNGVATIESDLGVAIAAKHFTDIDVMSREGSDVAYLRGMADGPNVFLGRSTFGRLTTPNEVLVANNFSLVSTVAGTPEDRASFVGTENDEEFYLNPNSARMVGDTFTLNASNYQIVSSNANGGQDYANITDSEGDDSLIARPGFARMLFSNGSAGNLTDFATIRSVSSMGEDSAQFNGSEESERFIASKQFGRLNSESLSMIAVSYPNVIATGGGGNDEAYLSDSDGDDFFLGSPTQSFLRGDGFRNSAIGFGKVVAFGTTGNDVAQFNGSDANDKFYANPSVADLTGEGYFQFATGFDFVRAYGHGGNDTATLRDSDDVDNFFANSELAYLRSENYHNEVRDFNSVRAISVAGADVATLNGSDGDELFHGHRDSSYIQGSGFRHQVNGFTSVTVFGLTGSDVANLHDSNEDEDFGGRNNTAWLEGETYRLQVTDFESVNAFGFQGGDNRFFVDNPDFAWERFGTWN